ncbi:hypothetical protein [Sphingomonas sp.]|uniref:hypothetical protein n=1 Tax=Sphingomonas sp. TaxID=28214 RepID=UPI003B00E6F1
MAQLARKHEETFDGEFVELPMTGAVIARWGDGAGPVDSPARLLHQRLIESFEPAPSAARELSARTRLAIVSGAVLLPWIAAGAVYLAL